MDDKYKEVLESLARLSDNATPGDWTWYGEQKAVATEEAFIEWARDLYQNTPENCGVMHFLASAQENAFKMTVSTGFGLMSAANAMFILAATAYVRGLIEIARERGDIAPAPNGDRRGDSSGQEGLDQGHERSNG